MVCVRINGHDVVNLLLLHLNVVTITYIGHTVNMSDQIGGVV